MNSPHFPSSLLDRPRSLSRLLLAMVGLMMAVALPSEAQVPGAPVLTLFAPANGMVSQPINYTLDYVGTATRFAVTGLPRGLTLNTTTGVVTGRPLVSGDFRIVFTAFNGTLKSAPLPVDWTVEPLPDGTVGTYNALLDRHDWYNGGYGGSLRVTVTASGSFSGTITRGIHRNSISGSLDTFPGETPVGRFMVPRRAPYTPLAVAFELPIGAKTLEGTLRESEDDVISVTGLKAVFSASVPATAYAGKWNTAYELPEGLTGNDIYPQGATWAAQTVGRTGVVTWTSRLADGTSSTFSTDLGDGGRTLVHLMLYNYAGSVQGTQTFNSGNGTTFGSLGWIKSSNYTRSYSSGFPLHFLSGAGSRYVAPVLGEMLFGITAGTNNARLIFSEGGLGGNFAQVFSLGLRNAISFPTGSANPYGIRMTINFSTGIVTGTGTAMDFVQNQPTNSRAGTFSGLLISNREQAVGHFLLPASRASNSQILSGRLIGEENFVNQ